MQIDSSLWAVPTAQLADRLHASLLNGDKADAWLHWWLEGFERPSSRVAARKLAAELAARRKADRWPFKRLFVKESNVRYGWQCA